MQRWVWTDLAKNTALEAARRAALGELDQAKAFAQASRIFDGEKEPSYLPTLAPGEPSSVAALSVDVAAWEFRTEALEFTVGRRRTTDLFVALPSAWLADSERLGTVVEHVLASANVDRGRGEERWGSGWYMLWIPEVWKVREVRAAAELELVVPPEERLPTPFWAMARDCVRVATKEQLSRWVREDCTVRTRIPRASTFADGANKTWASVALLTPPIPRDAAGQPVEVKGHAMACPECGAAYRYDRVGEHDDGMYEVTTTLRRLSSVEALRVAPPEERARKQGELPTHRAGWMDGIARGSHWCKAESAWNLCALAHDGRAWDEIVALLGNPAAIVRMEAARFALEVAETSEVPDAVVDRIAAMTRDEATECRRMAVTVDTTRRVARGEVGRVVDELIQDDDPVRIRAALAVLQSSLDAHVAEQCHRIAPLLGRGEPDVRTAAAYFVRACMWGPWHRVEPVPTLVALARSDDAGIVKAALTALAALREPCEALLPLLGRWCRERETEATAFYVLEAQGNAGADLGAFLPLLAERVARADNAAASRVLLGMLRRASDKVPVVRAMLPGVGGSWGWSLANAIDATVAQGHDLTELLPELRAVEQASPHLGDIIRRVEARGR